MRAFCLASPEKQGQVRSDMPLLDRLCKYRKFSNPSFVKRPSSTSTMYSRILSLPFILPLFFTVTPIPRADLGLATLDDDSLTFLDPDEQIFDTIIPLGSFDSDTDLFSTNECSDTADSFDPFWDDSLQARGNTCSADEAKTDDQGEGANSPTSEKPNSDIYDNSFQTEIDPLKRAFSLPKDYQDERCKEYDFVRYAVCSSGDYRDEVKSMSYSFFPIQAYRLRRCTFSESWISSREGFSIQTCKIALSITPLFDSVKVSVLPVKICQALPYPNKRAREIKLMRRFIGQCSANSASVSTRARSGAALYTPRLAASKSPTDASRLTHSRVDWVVHWFLHLYCKHTHTHIYISTFTDQGWVWFSCFNLTRHFT